MHKSSTNGRLRHSPDLSEGIHLLNRWRGRPLAVPLSIALLLSCGSGVDSPAVQAPPVAAGTGGSSGASMLTPTSAGVPSMGGALSSSGAPSASAGASASGTPSATGGASASGAPSASGGAAAGSAGLTPVSGAAGAGGLAPMDPPRPVVPPGQGLKGEYFKWSGTPELTPPALLTQIEGNIDFNGRPGSWEKVGPSLAIGHDYFSARWTGRLKPKVTDKYTLGTRSDDGSRVWIDGVQYVDDWALHDGSNHDFEMQLKAGISYDIRVEYFQKEGGAVMELSWSRTGDPSPPERIRPEFFAPPP